MTTQKRQQGFSLVELMVVVAIVGMLAALAYPSYRDQVRSTKRADCAGAMTGLANAMERHYSITGSYLGAANGGNNTGAPAIYARRCPIDGNTPTYNLRIQAATESTYRLRAIPLGAQAEDKCGRLNLRNTGAKSISSAQSGVNWKDCW